VGRRTNTRKLNLLGEWIKVRESFNADLVGISGRVVDETRNMLIVKDAASRSVSVPKAVCIFEVGLEEKVVIDGSVVVGRLERRLVGK
jgi:ribonuclease P protein subunit POP4